MPEANPNAVAGPSRVWADVEQVCELIPPLWGLDGYVAVNPFLGHSGRPLAEAIPEIGAALDARVLPPMGFYRERWAAGAFTRRDLEGAARRAGLDSEGLRMHLAGLSHPPLRWEDGVLTFAERHDREFGTGWSGELTRSVTRWCAVHASRGGPSWPLAAGRGLYASWREAARADRALEMVGLAGWRTFVGGAPECPRRAAQEMLERLEVTAGWRRAYLYRLLGGVFGWAGWLRREGWKRGEAGETAELLAVRVVADAAAALLAPRGRASRPVQAGRAAEEPALLVCLQEALEDGYARRLLARMRTPPRDGVSDRPEAQAVFCIDVRSEPLRRHLEAEMPGVQTLGFAGFFGVALERESPGEASARCPVLLRPAVKASCAGHAPSSWAKAVKKAPAMPAASFSFVETLGLGYALRLLGDALGLSPAPSNPEGEEPFRLEMDVEQRVALAEGILKNTGLERATAPLVLLCGHEGRSANNPHAAGLDCGACGGHGGALNARAAASLLNDPAVRLTLAERGRPLRHDTWFLAGVHDTSSDEVRLLDAEAIPPSHRAALGRLREGLARAGARTRAERAGALGLSGGAEGLGRRMAARAGDWSEVRPEWGLARNAAFIAARRARTRGVDLEGRAFLHEYDWRADEDASVLTLILTAPLVVASWINLQYFASTVDNGVFGCGTKTLHNRVGSLGVVLGNGGDLRTGLAAQSVHAPDGGWYHEPLRLQAVVEAPRERIDAVLAAHPGVAALAENGWLRLFALDPEGAGAWRRGPGGVWEAA